MLVGPGAAGATGTCTSLAVSASRSRATPRPYATAVARPAPLCECRPVLDGPVREGDLLWTPSPEQRARANITGFTQWLAHERQREFGSYDALWQWSVTDLDGFWGAGGGYL